MKVTESRPGGERVLNYVGRGGYIGEIALLSDLPELRGLAAPEFEPQPAPRLTMSTSCESPAKIFRKSSCGIQASATNLWTWRANGCWQTSSELAPLRAHLSMSFCVRD